MASTPKTIVFAMLHESGHLNPTFKLAKELVARGHRVRYLAIADAQPLIAAQGLEVLPLWPELFPAGVFAAEERLGTVARRRAITRRYRALSRVLREAPNELMAERPDLLLVDVTQPHFAFWARHVGVPFVYLNTSLPQTKDAGVPPLRSGRGFGGDPLSLVGAELDWQRFLVKRRGSAALADLAGMCPPYELARRLAAGFGIRPDELDWRTSYMPQLRGVPEWVLCPEAFDFPRPSQPGRTSIESVDLARSEAAFDWSPLAADRPLIFCALGGQLYRPREVSVFFGRLLEVMAARPAWQLLLSVGKHMAPEELGKAPANVRVVRQAPQLAVLRRARAMITHGGLGSIKECILHGVPMLAVPLDVDQPANAARVAYHGLGLVADVASDDRDVLLAKLSEVLDQPALRARVLAMRARFQELERAGHGVALVERRLGL